MSYSRFAKSAIVACAGGLIAVGGALALELVPGDYVITAYDKDSGEIADEVRVAPEQGGAFDGNYLRCKDDPETRFYASREGSEQISLGWYRKPYVMMIERITDAGEREEICEFNW